MATTDVLLASLPLAGHTLPLRPIARALVRRGHRVRWCTDPRFAAAVTDTGAEFVALTLPPRLDPERADPLRSSLTGMAANRWDLRNLFLAPALEQYAQLRRIVSDQPADLVVCDTGFQGARLLGEAGGPPWVTIGISPLVLPSRDLAPYGLGLPPDPSPAGRARAGALRRADRYRMRGVARFLDNLRARVGLPPWREPVVSAFCSPYLHLQAGVPGLEYPRSDLPAHVRFVGALIDPDGNAPAPPWWPSIADRPVVHVTQGTFANADPRHLILPTIRALAAEDVRVVATLGRAVSPADLGGATNAWVVDYLPYRQILARAAVMVTNGGYGGVQYALSAGVPLVVAGATEDKPEVAARIAWAGAGIDLRTGRPDPERIRAAVRSVLRDPSYLVAAGRLAAQFARLDAGPCCADLIEAVLPSLTPCAR